LFLGRGFVLSFVRGRVLKLIEWAFSIDGGVAKAVRPRFVARATISLTDQGDQQATELPVKRERHGGIF